MPGYKECLDIWRVQCATRNTTMMCRMIRDDVVAGEVVVAGEGWFRVWRGEVCVDVAGVEGV